MLAWEKLEYFSLSGRVQGISYIHQPSPEDEQIAETPVGIESGVVR